ncbi:MAG: sugar phosphate isomerase/epimerase family protein [Lachnospiraceae bacterium]
MSEIKLGVTLYCFTREYITREMSLEDCIRKAKEIGSQGYEMVATQMVPDYPFVSDRFLGEIEAIGRHYDIHPICYSANMDKGVLGYRDLTEDELLQRAITDIKSANRMGCKVLRAQYLLGTGAFERLAPYAESYNVKVGIEIHNPETPYTPIMQEYLNVIQKTGSKYLGFIPDFGMFATKPNKPMWDEALAAGTPLELMEQVRDMRYEGRPQDEAMALLMENHAPAAAFGAVQGMYGFVQFKNDCYKELEGLKEIMPYCFHMHGKFHYMDENFVEASIPYDQIMPVIAASDFDGFIVSEYEDHASGNAVEMTTRHMKMMQSYLKR